MSINRRLARVERQCGWLKAGFALVTVALAVALLIGAGQDQDKPKVLEEVRARRLLIVDDAGNEHVWIRCRRGHCEFKLRERGAAVALCPATHPT